MGRVKLERGQRGGFAARALAGALCALVALACEPVEESPRDEDAATLDGGVQDGAARDGAAMDRGLVEEDAAERDGATPEQDAGEDPDAALPEHDASEHDASDHDAAVADATAPPADAGEPSADAVAPDPDAGPCPDGLALDECGICGGPGDSIYYADADGDGLGDPRIWIRACAAPEGFVDNADDPEPDCATNDTDACGICGGPGPLTLYADQDGDGLGDPDTRVESCRPLDGWVANADDAEPRCATNDTDACGVCGGPGPQMLYADQDGDGLGDPSVGLSSCGPVMGFVDNADDPEPNCATNDTDECGVCGGEGAKVYYADQDGDGLGDPAVSVRSCDPLDGFVTNSNDPEPNCATNDTDGCGVCGGGERDRDCLGVCFGEAFIDGCERCVGGLSGHAPAVADRDGDGVPDLCDQCTDPGAPRGRLIVQWTAVPSFGNRNGGPYTFQVILDENGDFLFQYLELENHVERHSVGWQGRADREPRQFASLGVNSELLRDHRVIDFIRREDGRPEADYTRPLEWMDIRHVGERLPLGDDDVESVAIGFDFPLEDRTYEHVEVSANGVLSFTQPVPGFAHGPLPDARYGAFLAPLWTDLNPAAGGTVHIYRAPATCEADCAGMFGGVAATDACGACFGGTTGFEADRDLDCNGDCFGEAAIDICRICSGGETGIEPTPPEACHLGPDLIVDEPYLRNTLMIQYLTVNDPCLIEERCVQDVGDRKLLRFGTRIANIGNEDLQLGAPSDEFDWWIWSQCHGHYHFEAYAAYDLKDLATNEVLPIGAKNGFAVIDIGVYDPAIATEGCRGYNGRNQGITAGCQDTYSRSLQCQWIDITNVPDGEYEVIITTNPDRQIVELDYENNTARARVRITGDQVQVLD